ncbi:MAG: hypothetical protein K2X91_07990, partial [Thermoleophilia bacterium]|nr:hypothetical protein [Thermoleophilia bacterium]
ASDVPARLRALRSGTPDERMQACAELHETIWHQGTVYPASTAVVPFLVELLAHPDEHASGCAASLLACIATGEGWLTYALRVDGEAAVRRRLAARGRTPEDEADDERAALASIRRGTAAGLKGLLPFLCDREGLAPLVAETLGFFPEHASWLRPAVAEAFARETDPDVRRSLAGCLDRLSSGAACDRLPYTR